MNSALAINTLKAADVQLSPYPFLVIKDFINPEFLQQTLAEFPDLSKGGSFPLAEVPTNKTLQQVADIFDGQELRDILSAKFDVDLQDKPLLLTLRGYSRAKDGRVHTDSKTKILTVLIYLNEDWQEQTGNLRVLGSNDLQDTIKEIPATGGLMMAFKVTDNCWHGYPSFEGKRQSIQINYIVGDGAAKKHRFFHGVSAKLKSLTK